jgi:hypothetical protein
MPAILCDPHVREAWLDPALDQEALAALLQPIEPELLTRSSARSHV